jgi:hypothetical protein
MINIAAEQLTMLHSGISSMHTAAVGHRKWFTRHIRILAPAYQDTRTPKQNPHARNQQEAKPAAVCMRAHLPANERAIPHSPLLPQSDTCATDLCLDGRIGDGEVGRESDNSSSPCRMPKSAKTRCEDAVLRRFSLEGCFAYKMFPLVSAIGRDMPH